MSNESLFTRNKIVGYYLPAIRTVCHCGGQCGVSYGKEIMVSLEDGSSLTLHELHSRYAKLFRKYTIPRHKVELREITHHVDMCWDCTPSEIGDEDCPNPFCPAPVPEKYSMERQEVLTPAATKPTSRKIKRETQEERDKRLARNQLRNGDLGALFRL